MSTKRYQQAGAASRPRTGGGSTGGGGKPPPPVLRGFFPWGAFGSVGLPPAPSSVRGRQAAPARPSGAGGRDGLWGFRASVVPPAPPPVRGLLAAPACSPAACVPRGT